MEWPVGPRAAPVVIPPGGTGWRLLCCFRCNQLGHRVAKCPALVPQGKAGPPGKLVSSAGPAQEKSRAACQMGSPTRGGAEEGEAPATVKYPEILYDSGDEVPEDPMVSNPIRPFIISVTVTGPQSGRSKKYGALIDMA